MKFTKGYELIYEKAGKFYGCETRVPNKDTDVELSVTRADLEEQGYKLVYVKGDALKGSTSGIPAEDDTVIVSVNEEEAEAVVAEELAQESEPVTPAAAEEEEEIIEEAVEVTEDVE